MTFPSRRRFGATTAGIALAASVALVASACGSGDASEGSGYEGEIGALDLSVNCPSTVVIQTDWNPQAEHGHLYQLLGPDPVINGDAKRTVGPLFDQGEYTGVDIEIRAGGPAIGYEAVTAQMYTDPDIMLGYVDSDQSIQNSANNATTAVMAPLEISPQMIMWDPETYPQVREIADLRAENATVLYFEGSTYMRYLVGSGVLDEAQVDSSYDGTPANFVAAGGASAQQGYASSEPFIYQEEVDGWGKPVDFQLVHDTGFETYKSAMAVRSSELDGYASCLEQLVPVLQRGIVDYFEDPSKANQVIIDAVEAYDTGWVYGQQNADYSIGQMRELGLISNGDNATVGDFDEARIARLIEQTTPIFTEQNTAPAEGLRPADVFTNQFIDTSIGLP